MGFITNIALSRADFIRTKHPIYSFAVSGKYSQDFFQLNNKGSFDSDSPFAMLERVNAKMLLVDVDYQNSFTFVHYVEECNSVSYRYNKNFEANYINPNGIKKSEIYSMFVRNENVQTNVNPIGEILENCDVSKYKIIDELETRLIDLNKSFKIISQDINENCAKNLYIEKI